MSHIRASFGRTKDTIGLLTDARFYRVSIAGDAPSRSLFYVGVQAVFDCFDCALNMSKVPS